MLLTDQEFIRRLEMLHMLARKVLGGSLRADRKSDKKGSGILFADYSEYKIGDDYRSIDWNIFARMEQLVVRMYELEEDLSIYILLDTSMSMQSKTHYSRQLAAALGYIALNNADRLGVYGISKSMGTILDPCHGKSAVFKMLRNLQDAPLTEGGTYLNECVKAFHTRRHRKGICVIISDFFTPGGYDEALRLLRFSKHEVFCIQVLDPTELQCDLKGDIELECIETQQKRHVVVGPAEAARYREAMTVYNDTLQRYCLTKEIGFARAMTDIPFDEIIQDILRKGGLVR